VIDVPGLTENAAMWFFMRAKTIAFNGKHANPRAAVFGPKENAPALHRHSQLDPVIRRVNEILFRP
jgi:hypothetical protein